MDSFSNFDERNDLERRLAQWRPAGGDLNAAAMLVAVGRAAARADKRRLIWPAAAVCLAVLAGFLAVRWDRALDLNEALVARLQWQNSIIAPQIEAPAAPNQPAPHSYLATRQLVEQDPDDWPPPAIAKSDSPAAPPNRPILRAWRAELELDLDS